MKILVIGYGVVGKNVYALLKTKYQDVKVTDPNLGMLVDQGEKFDVAFVCVPTPSFADGSCDTSAVSGVVDQFKNDVEIFVLKSTVPPGTTYDLNDVADVVFVPEYYGATLDANAPTYDFTIIGVPDYPGFVGEFKGLHNVLEIHKRVQPGSHRLHLTDSRTAELAKYMENCFLAAKVAFCAEFEEAARALAVSYEEVRELWLLDPRMGRSHTTIIAAQPFYDSHCLNKDVAAFISWMRRVRYDREEPSVGPAFMAGVSAANAARRTATTERAALASTKVEQ